MLYNVHVFSSKCRLFHNATLFGFCITHILNAECAKIKKKKSVAKRLNCESLMILNTVYELIQGFGLTDRNWEGRRRYARDKWEVEENDG